MRLIVGAPVAERAWALPSYFRCLAAQTRRPDGFVFIHSGRVADDTWRAVLLGAARHGCKPVALHHHERPPHQRHDNQRFHTLAACRNAMLRVAHECLHADLFLSLDTDVMLENPRTIERLVTLLEQGYDVASPVTWLHPAGEGSWAYNAGWWTPDGELDDPQRQWMRPGPDKVPWGEVLDIDVPMAVMLMGRRAMDCRYKWHEAGEDLGFAQDLDRHGLRVAWDTSLKCRHVWQANDLENAA